MSWHRPTPAVTHNVMKFVHTLEIATLETDTQNAQKPKLNQQVRTTQIGVLMTLYNSGTQYSTQQFG